MFLPLINWLCKVIETQLAKQDHFVRLKTGLTGLMSSSYFIFGRAGKASGVSDHFQTVGG